MKLFAVLPNSKIHISNCMKSGLNDYIEQDKLKEECLLCRIDKLLNLTDENIVEVCSKGNIYINSDTQIAYISGKKIELTESETKIMKYMLEKDEPCTLKDLNTYLGSDINDKSVGMLIYRLEKKMRYILGYSVIKNKYRKGYYIEY